MTKKEVLTMILEEGRRVFENGESFTINGMLVANFNKSAELCFDYEGGTDIIRMVYVFYDGHVVACIGTDYIERVKVSDSWCMWTDSDNVVRGCADGEYYSW